MFDSEWVVTHCIVCLYVTSKIFFSFLIKDFYSITTKVLNQATLGGMIIIEFWNFEFLGNDSLIGYCFEF